MKHKAIFCVAFLVLAALVTATVLMYGLWHDAQLNGAVLQARLNDREATLHQMTLDKDKLVLEKAEIGKQLFKQLIYSRITEGLVSWYGDREHGNLTANGERFDKNAFTVASRTLPFGTIVLVENIQTGAIAPALVNDRGPYIDGRIADLSEALALRLGFREAGLMMARVYEVRKTT